jgi:hypothetical protein
MTEAEWLGSTYPREMLDFVFQWATARKQTLFGVACFRRAQYLIGDERIQQAVEAAERYADGLLTQKEFRRVADAAGMTMAPRYSYSLAATVLATLLHWLDLSRAVPAADQCALLRELFHPFRPITLDPAWLTWNNSLIGTMAQVIYDERRFADLPILADALEESGCYNNDILDHCRSPEDHVRGCWVVDLLLAKE